MNEGESNLHPWIEPELEARIIALVLGESSDFETEELERLIEEQPELAMFRKRMEAMHGLLHEATSGEPENAVDEWKLSDDRRNAILAVIEGAVAKEGDATVSETDEAGTDSETKEDPEPVVEPMPVSMTGQKRRQVRWIRLVSMAAAACLFLFVGFAALMQGRLGSKAAPSAIAADWYGEDATVESAPESPAPLSYSKGFSWGGEAQSNSNSDDVAIVVMTDGAVPATAMDSKLSDLSLVSASESSEAASSLTKLKGAFGRIDLLAGVDVSSVDGEGDGSLKMPEMPRSESLIRRAKLDLVDDYRDLVENNTVATADPMSVAGKVNLSFPEARGETREFFAKAKAREQVEVGGLSVLSTLDIDSKKFMRGQTESKNKSGDEIIVTAGNDRNGEADQRRYADAPMKSEELGVSEFEGQQQQQGQGQQQEKGKSRGLAAAEYPATPAFGLALGRAEGKLEQLAGQVSGGSGSGPEPVNRLAVPKPPSEPKPGAPAAPAATEGSDVIVLGKTGSVIDVSDSVAAVDGNVGGMISIDSPGGGMGGGGGRFDSEAEPEAEAEELGEGRKLAAKRPAPKPEPTSAPAPSEKPVSSKKKGAVVIEHEDFAISAGAITAVTGPAAEPAEELPALKMTAEARGGKKDVYFEERFRTAGEEDLQRLSESKSVRAKVPALGKLPLIGKLFKKAQSERAASEAGGQQVPEVAELSDGLVMVPRDAVDADGDGVAVDSKGGYAGGAAGGAETGESQPARRDSRNSNWAYTPPMDEPQQPGAVRGTAREPAGDKGSYYWLQSGKEMEARKNEIAEIEKLAQSAPSGQTAKGDMTLGARVDSLKESGEPDSASRAEPGAVNGATYRSLRPGLEVHKGHGQLTPIRTAPELPVDLAKKVAPDPAPAATTNGPMTNESLRSNFSRLPESQVSGDRLGRSESRAKAESQKSLPKRMPAQKETDEMDLATIDASGSIGGGSIQIGGAFKGRNPQPNAAEKATERSLTAIADSMKTSGQVKGMTWDVPNARGQIVDRNGTEHLVDAVPLQLQEQLMETEGKLQEEAARLLERDRGRLDAAQNELQRELGQKEDKAMKAITDLVPRFVGGASIRQSEEETDKEAAIQWNTSNASFGAFASGNVDLETQVRTSGAGSVDRMARWTGDESDIEDFDNRAAAGTDASDRATFEGLSHWTDAEVSGSTLSRDGVDNTKFTGVGHGGTGTFSLMEGKVDSGVVTRKWQEGFKGDKDALYDSMDEFVMEKNVERRGTLGPVNGTVALGAGGEILLQSNGHSRISVRSGAKAIDGDSIDGLISESALGWASQPGLLRDFVTSTGYDPPELRHVEVGSRFGKTVVEGGELYMLTPDGKSNADKTLHLGFRDKGKAFAAQRVAPPSGLEEKNAAEESFSTFSLHVSDVSFKLAQAALAKGEWPEAGKVRIEEFVNALDYGDPNPSQEDKVACRVEQAIHPFLQQRNLMRVAMRTAAAGRAGDTPLRLTFLLDNSGSMERADREETVRRAFALLADQLQPIDQVTLISFARQPRLLADKVSGDQSRNLVEVVSNLPSEGGTNLEAALKLAFEKAQEQKADNAQNRIVLLTDGAANLGNARPESLAAMIESMREEGIAFDAAGIGADGLNDEILEALTRKGDGRYYLLDRPEDADDGFARQIAGALRPAAKNVKVQVEFNPERVGNYKLLGFEKHRLKKEDFRDDTVDAAEMAAEEAGVAVYQFEAKPDGEGDVGFVSVRFRDMSTGEMVEQRWPIPYEPSAPRPDQAAPSMQIAAAAALFAAKLNGEPLGDTVELDELARTVGSLPESFQNKERVQQLRQMIEQARELATK